MPDLPYSSFVVLGSIVWWVKSKALELDTLDLIPRATSEMQIMFFKMPSLHILLAVILSLWL